MDIVIIECVINEDESNCRVDVDDNDTKHSRHQQLVTIDSYRLNNVLQLGESVDNIKQMERVEDGRLE